MKLIRFFFVSICVVSFLFAQNVESQIKNSSQNLANKELEEKELNRHLEEIAKSLKKEEDELTKTDKKISSLNKKISEQQGSITVTKKELSKLDEQNKELIKRRDELEKNLAELIAQDFSYMLVIDQGYIENSEAIVTNEILKVLSKQANEKFDEYSQEFLVVDEKIQKGTKRVESIQKSIEDLEKQKNELSNLKVTKAKIIKDIEKEKSVYVKKLQDLQAQKNELKKTLESLKIIEEESKKPKEVVVKPNVALTTDEKIRQIGSSYQASKVKKYTGTKTFAPLEKYTVVQKFGDYIDPVYNIKIFNESIVLRSAKENSEVKNVLDGKVIFAKDTQLLKNVVIVENSNGIHTIYAHLSKIAPTIKIGSKIKKGYVIGRVERDLTFEVTQKNYHINPLDLIHAK